MEKKKPFISSSRIITLIFSVILFVLVSIYYLTTLTESTSEEIPKPVKLEKYIAVLPFKDLSPEGDKEYLANGISDMILRTLTEIENLKVIDLTSSFQFQGKDVDLREECQKL